MSKELVFSITKKDFDITFFSGTGAGGQHRNKHQNSVRMKHRDSGVIATGQDSKSRRQNLKSAFNTLISKPEFKIWLKREISTRLHEGVSLHDKVKRMMAPENLKIEVL